MRILILSWRGPKHPNAGGAEISTYEHAKGWVKAGHSVTLFTSAFIGCKEEEIINGIRIIRSGMQVFGVQWAVFRWYLFADHPKFDLIVDQFHGIPFFTPIYVKEKKLAFIHEVTKEVWGLNPWPWPFNQIVAFIGQKVEPLVFKLFYKSIPFMTVSQSTKQDLVDWGIPKRNITIIHNGINIPKTNKLHPVRLKLSVKEKKKTAVFLGSISKDKGIEDTIYIFKEIDNQDKDWQFWVIGKSDLRYLKVIKNTAKELGIFNKINFFGYVSERKKFELLSKAHVVVNPSIREGWGLTVIEAARVGTPSVGYNVAGLRDSIIDGKTGVLCKIDPIKCSKVVLTLINDEKKYKELKKNCIQWGSKFNWAKATRESLKLIEGITR